MATKKIQIEFDLNSNDVKIASEATLTLAQQVRVLKQELQKTQEGTKEFEILKNKLNETKDNFERVNVKSRELFGTLSLIPGPVGEIAGKLNGAISLMKTFSGFSFKDIRGQFKALTDDIKGILINLGSWGEATKEVKDSQDSFTESLKKSTDNASAAGAQIQQNIAVTKQLSTISKDQVKELEQKIENEKTYQLLLREAKKDIEGVTVRTKEQKQELGFINNELKNSEAYQKRYQSELNGIKTSTEAATAATNTQTLATKASVVAANTASTAFRVLKGVLASLGIGLLIVAITTLISKVVEWVSSTKEADEANQALGDTLEFLNRVIEDNLALVDEEVQANILRAKEAGKTEKEIQEIERKGFKDRLAILKKGQEDLFNEEASSKFLKLTKEQQKQKREEIIKEQNNLQKQINKIQSDARLFELKINADAAEERRKNAKDANEKILKDNQEALEKRKAQLDAAIQLEIDKANTDEKILRDLLKKRLELEKLSGAQLLLAQQENDKKIREAIKDDAEKRRQAKIDDYDALIQIEQSQADVDVERLIKLLQKKRDVELTELGLTEEQKKAIIAKYEADFRKLRQDEREKQLVEDINANRGNIDAQIDLLRQFNDEVIASENYTAGEKLRIQQETNQKIEELQQQRLQNEINELDLSLMNSELTYEEYYDKLDQIYADEETRYKDLLDKKLITEQEYNQKVKEISDARIDIRKAELDAQIQIAQAIADSLSTLSSIFGEQTKAGKALAVAASLINTYAAIAGQLKAFAGVPIPGYAIAQAIATGLVGFAQVRKIVATQVPNTTTSNAQFAGGVINVNQRRAQGGFIAGPGGETSDNIPALLSNGEFVINSRSTRAFRPLLETINSAATLPAFAAGGLVKESGGMQPFKSQNETIADALSTAFGQTPIKTYVTATEVSTQQQFDRIIKSRSII